MEGKTGNKTGGKTELNKLLAEIKKQKYKWVVLFEDFEDIDSGVYFLQEDIEDKLNSKGDFIRLGDIVVNKSYITGVVTVDKYIEMVKEDTPTLATNNK